MKSYRQMTVKKLQHIAPTLAKLQEKGTGFSVPKAYFDAIEESLAVILALQNPKELHVPKDYFEHVESYVFDRLKKDNNLKATSLRKYWIPATIAASLLFLMSIYNPFSQKNTIEVTEIEQWISAGNLDLTSYEIADVFESDIDSFDIETQINEEDLEAYLEDTISESIFYD